MIKSLNKYLLLIIIIIACSSGGNSPTDPGDNNGGGDNTNPYEFPNAVDYGLSNQIEIVTWNIRQFPQHSSTKDYVKNLLEKWNADIYFFQEIRSESELISMVDTMPNYSYVVDEESGNLGFALVYKNQYITFNSKNELWADTANNDDGDSDYYNNAAYQFADRPPMENYLTWSDGTKTLNLYLIGIHYKCCGDDSYNANPESVKAALDYLNRFKEHRKIFVFGDMKELGENGDNLHKEIGKYTDGKANILLTVGKLAKNAQSNSKNFALSLHFNDNFSLLEKLNELLTDGDVVLIKGSRSMHLDQLVNELKKC